MTEFIITIVSSTTVSGLLVAGLIFLSKSLISERLKNAIKNEYDIKLETYKDKLKNESDANLTKLKAELQIAAAEHSTRLSLLGHINNTKFTRIDSDRAKAIKQIYYNLFELEYAGLQLNEKLGDLNAEDKDVKDKSIVINNQLASNFNKIADIAMNNLSINAIYFDISLFSHLFTTIDSFIKDTKNVMDQFQQFLKNDDFKTVSNIKTEYQSILESNYLLEKVKLTEELRKVLGSNQK